MKIKLLLAIFLFQSFFAKAQEEKKEEYNMYKLPVIGVGVGIVAFKGDVANNYKQNAFSRFRPGYNLYVEQRFLPWLGVSLNGLYGAVSANERSATSNRNFYSKIMQGDLNLTFHFDNGFMEKKDASITPFFGIGVGYLMFDAHGDLTDKNGNNYNYWTDGSIRDLPQADSNIFKSKVIQRDYKYESQLKDSVVNYKRTAIVIPLTFGLTMKLTDFLNVNFLSTFFDVKNFFLSYYLQYYIDS